METKYTIKNFRVFNERGTSLDLKPLTLLTGCNSSGKSSIVKSLLLLCDYLSSLKEDKKDGKTPVLTSHGLNFMEKPHSNLGRFTKIVNKEAKDKRISFEVQVHSLMLGQDIDVLIDYTGDEKSFNGYLSSISIKKLNGDILYSSKEDGKSTGNLYSILPEFIDFVYTQHLIKSYQNIYTNKTIGYDEEIMSDDDFNIFITNLNAYLADFVKEKGSRFLRDINQWNNNQRSNPSISSNASFLYKYSGNTPEMLSEVKTTGILYYLPIFDEKLRGNKEECSAFLSSCINSKLFNRATLCIIEKILKDFNNSSFDSFICYYKSLEKKYLSEYVINYTFSKEKSPKLFSSNFVGLEANNIMLSPHNLETTPIDLTNDKLELSHPINTKDEEILKWEALPLSFSVVFEVLAILSEHFVPEDTLYYNRPNGKEYWEYSSRTEYLFFKFLEAVVEEIVIDATPEALYYVSSSIINVKRLYPMESDDEFTALLKRYITANKNLKKESDYKKNSFLNKWIKKFEIGKSVIIKVDDEGLGITLRLHKSDNDEDDSLLADNGYGLTQLFAILLNIEIAIMERDMKKVLPYNCINPLPKETDYMSVYTTPTIAIEEPEIHLHPNFQSLLADMFFDAYNTYGIHFIIETHSEYLIRRIQVVAANLFKSGNNDVPFKVFYFTGQSNNPCYDMGFQKNGKFEKEFGPGFFNVADDSAMELFDLENES